MSGPDLDVYGTAKSALRSRAGSAFAARMRRRRHERLFALTGIDRSSRVLDVGCGRVGLLGLAPDLDVTGVDVVARPEYPGSFVLADATVSLPFADDEFDLAYSSSVIEHIPPESRAPFAAELKRVARGWYVQTPAYSFPVEPHALLPFAHWLPPQVRRPYWRLGVAGGWDDVKLLRRRELESLFGTVVAERMGPLAKSWIALRPVPRS